MQELPLESIPSLPVLDRKWYQIWWEVWKYRNEEGFRSILRERNHSYKRGLIWILTTGLISSFVQISLSTLLLHNYISGSVVSTILMDIYRIVRAPIIGIVSLLFYSLVFHWVARLFKGNGNLSDLIFCLTALFAPGYLLNQLITIFINPNNSGQASYWIPLCLLSLIGLYMIYLNILVIKVVENVTKGQAITTVIIFYGLLFIVISCLFFMIIIASIK